MSYEFGDIVLVPFPFTNQAAAKRRPAVIVSGSAYNQAKADIVVMAITSQFRVGSGFGEALIAHWQQAGLMKPSCR